MQPRGKTRVSRDGSPYPSVSWIIPCIALQFWARSTCVASLGIVFAFEDDPGFNLFAFALDVCGVIRQGCVERSTLSRKRVSWLGGLWGLGMSGLLYYYHEVFAAAWVTMLKENKACDSLR